YPEEGETTNILNFKRGIVSALAVPLVEEDKNKYMPTIHGKCKTYYTINAREDIATDMTLNRDLSGCDKFIPIKDHTSPLALISGMHYPLSKMVRSSQTCNYKFDNEKKHMTSGSCTENHILIPFSHKGEYGVTNVGKQELTLVEVSAHNDRVFDLNTRAKGLHIETVEDKYAVQDKDAALNILRELATLSEADGEKRAHLFHVLVYLVRGMKTETLSPAIPEALEVSRVLTYQVLAQCGTPQCSSAIMQILRSFDSASLEVDASVFALGLMSNPSELLINDMLEMAKYKSSKPIMYALSNVVKRFYKAEEKLTPEIFSVAEFMAGKLGDCSGDNDETFMTLRVIGNMAPALVNAGPALRGAVMQCVNQPAASPAVQQAAIQVFRLTPAPEEVREVFMQVLLDGASPMQKRIAAYLVLMKDPQTSELTQLVNALPTEQDQQVKSFVISHLTNILSSTVPETLELRQRILEALQGNDIEPTMDPTKFSRNYKIGSLEGNMLFDSSSYLPKEVMLDMTLKAFGFDIDMMEIGMEGKGFEPTVEALFGENGFFPDTVMKTIYFVSDNMPEQVSEMLQNIVPALKRNRMKRQAHMNFMRDIGRNLNKLVRDLKDAQSPEAMVYMRLLGNELGYLRTNEMEEMAYSLVMMIDSMFKMFPTDIMKALMTKADNTIFAHYIFMDNEFFLPTMTGVPLRVALSGTFTPGLKGGLQMPPPLFSFTSKITFMPSAGAEFVTQVGSYFPEYVHSGLEMQTNFFHESGLTAEIAMARDNIKLTIPAPTTPTKFITMTNSLVAVVGSEIKTIPALVMEKVDVTDCSPVFAGMKYCTSLQYTDAFTEETAPYFPFTGDSKFSVELHPTGEVTEYTATVSYEVLRMGEEGRQKVDSVKVILRAEGILQMYFPSLYSFQLLVPSLKSDATFTAHMKRGDELELDLQSIINFLGTTSKQTAMNNYLEKYGADFPYIQNFRVPDMPEITLPETLFMNVDTKVVYFFNPKSFTIVLPLPLGGKSAEELNFPPALTTPQMSVPQLGLEIVSIEVPVPDFVIPERLSLTIPYFGKAEVEAAVESNLYNMDASVMVGKEDMEVAKYSAKFDVKGTSPIDILSLSSFILQLGSGMLDATESIKAELKSSLTHKLLEASVTILEDASITDKISLKSNSKVEVTSPLGLNVVLEHTGMAGINTEEISADNNFEGSFKAGPIFGKTVSTQTFAIFPLRPEAKIDSSVQLDSTILKAQNTIAATFANGEVSVVSNTNAYEDVLTHVIELSFKDGRLSLKSDANALALGMKIRNQAEASTGLSEVIVRIETNADQSENRVYSLLTASFDSNGLALNSDANMKIFENEATHKAALTLNKDGLATSGTTTLQSIVSLENTFSGGLDVSYADMTATAKCSTTGKLLGTHMNQNTEVEIIGLAARITNDARFNSQPIRIDHTIRCSIVPFDFNLDAIFNGDGDLTMYGKHSAQLYGKFLLRAQPLAFSSSHECRASVTQQLDNGFTLETTADNKMETALSFEEQRTNLKLKFKVNENTLSQEFSVYNTAERTGVEGFGTILTNILNTDSEENQEYTISGFLKYDKNTDSHIIHFPLIDSLPVVLDSLKGLVGSSIAFLSDIDAEYEIKVKLEAILGLVRDAIDSFDIAEIKNYITSLDFKAFIEDLVSKIPTETLTEIMDFTKEMIEELDIIGKINNFFTKMREMIVKFDVEQKVQAVFDKVVELIQQFRIKETISLMIPAFGKLYGEIKFLTPIYTMKTSAEVQNSTETEMTPQFTGFFSSQGTSPSFEVFNYKVDSTARLAIPKWSRIVVAETLKLNHQVLGVEHQASVTLYAFIAMEGGISASLDTTVTQVVDLPIFNVKNEFTATQKSVLRQDGYTITLTADNSGTGKFNAETGNHNSKLILSLTPTLVSMTFNGDTDSSIMKMKQQINAELRPITSITFSVRNEAEGPFIKNSLLVVSGLANLYDLKAELKANHDAELYGPVSGVLSNGVNFIIRPIEFVFEFQNKGNAKVNILDSLTGKIDLQNDYSVNFKPESQQVNTVALVRLNQYKIFYNFTMDNNVNEASILAAMESEANLDFLKSPISIPEIDLPFVDFHTPAISDLNLYEQAGLDNILTTTDQTLDVDAKIVYKKSQAVPLVSMMGLTLVPSVGNLITELSFKSAIINLNVNAGLYTEDDLVLRLGAVTASVFEGLNAKLDGTTSLTTKRGIKLANSMSLENRHIEGTHDSTFSVSTDTFETAVSVNTVAKVALPVLSLEASQNLVADNKNKATAVSTWMMKGNFNLPLIKIDARAEADHSLKLEGTFEYVSMESSTKANIDGTIFEDYLLVGVMDNEATLYLNKDGLRSTSKIIADGKLNHGTDKIIGMDVNENLAIEASLSRVYVVLKYTGSNDVNMFDFFTNGKHIAQATIDFVPVSSLTADIEIDFSQPTNFGDFTIFEKTVADITGAKQKISANGKVVSPLYTTDISAELEGIAPVFKVILKSSATSPIVLLEYNMDGMESVLQYLPPLLVSSDFSSVEEFH
uniref:Vitellogenin domain-containing protein n=1 Tax=Salarias fasciatus TaxID=181472 RepID=A0A672H2G7_SALFA